MSKQGSSTQRRSASNVSRRRSTASSTGSASSTPSISVDGYDVRDMRGTPQWGLAECTLTCSKIVDIKYNAGPSPAKDTLLLICAVGRKSSDTSSVTHNKFTLPCDRLVLGSLINVYRDAARLKCTKDFLNQAKQSFLEKHPVFIANMVGYKLGGIPVAPKIYEKHMHELSNTPEQLPLPSIPHTFEWYACQKTQTTGIKDLSVDWDDGLLLHTVDGVFRTADFLSLEDTKVLAHLRNLLARRPQQSKGIKAKFIFRYPSISYNEGFKKLVASPDWRKKGDRPYRKYML